MLFKKDNFSIRFSIFPFIYKDFLYKPLSALHIVLNDSQKLSKCYKIKKIILYSRVNEGTVCCDEYFLINRSLRADLSCPAGWKLTGLRASCQGVAASGSPRVL